MLTHVLSESLANSIDKVTDGQSKGMMILETGVDGIDKAVIEDLSHLNILFSPVREIFDY